MLEQQKPTKVWLGSKKMSHQTIPLLTYPWGVTFHSHKTSQSLSEEKKPVTHYPPGGDCSYFGPLLLKKKAQKNFPAPSAPGFLRTPPWGGGGPPPPKPVSLFGGKKQSLNPTGGGCAQG